MKQNINLHLSVHYPFWSPLPLNSGDAMLQNR